MPSITVPSGAKVVINEADYGDAMALKSAIQREVAASGLKFDFDLNKPISGQKLPIDAMVAAALSADSSEAVQAALFKCLIRCTYNSEKITKDTFNPKAARPDYYPIVVECIKENILPFYAGLTSSFSNLLTNFTAPEATDQK